MKRHNQYRVKFDKKKTSKDSAEKSYMLQTGPWTRCFGLVPTGSTELDVHGNNAVSAKFRSRSTSQTKVKVRERERRF